VKTLTLSLTATALALGSMAFPASAQTQTSILAWACGTFEYANKCNAVLRPPYRHCECIGAPSKRWLRSILVDTGARESAASRGGP
jgi:hypothetical protein